MTKLSFVFCLVLGVLIGAVIMQVFLPHRADYERALRVIEDYRTRCRNLDGLPLTGPDFLFCFRRDALIYVPPRKE